MWTDGTPGIQWPSVTSGQPLLDGSLWQVQVAAEMPMVERLVEVATWVEFPGLAQILQAALLTGRPRWLGATSVLASLARPDAISTDARVRLAAGLEVLQGAIAVHDQMVAGVGLLSRGGGANVLLGDTAFSRAARLVSQTNSPGAVLLFSQVLAATSQMRLQRLIERQSHHAGTAADLPNLAVLGLPVLYAGACEAGALLAGEDEGHRRIFHAAGGALGRLVQSYASHRPRSDTETVQSVAETLADLPFTPAVSGLLSLAQSIVEAGTA